MKKIFEQIKQTLTAGYLKSMKHMVKAKDTMRSVYQGEVFAYEDMIKEISRIEVMFEKEAE